MTDTKLKPGMMFTNDVGVWRIVDERDSETGDLPEREIKVRAVNTETAEQGDTEWLTESEATRPEINIVDSIGYTERDVESATVITMIPYTDEPEFREYNVTGEQFAGWFMSMEDPEHSEHIIDADLTFKD